MMKLNFYAEMALGQQSLVEVAVEASLASM
jgi:hypothetical protein